MLAKNGIKMASYCLAMFEAKRAGMKVVETITPNLVGSNFFCIYEPRKTTLKTIPNLLVV